MLLSKMKNKSHSAELTEHITWVLSTKELLTWDLFYLFFMMMEPLFGWKKVKIYYRLKYFWTFFYNLKTKSQ